MFRIRNYVVYVPKLPYFCLKSVGVLYPKPHTYKCQLPKISRFGKLEGFQVKLYAIVRIQKKSTEVFRYSFVYIEELFYSYNFGPASTNALPASAPVNLLKFLMKRPAKSLAFSSHLQAHS